jgi:NDP-sugar pyrophosphorylase family protein
MLYIVGNTAFVKPVLDFADAMGLTIDGIVDVNTLLGMEAKAEAKAGRVDWPQQIPQLADLEALKDVEDLELIVAIEDNKMREDFVKFAVGEKLNAKFISLIHPSAILSPSALIGEGSIVLKGAYIGPDVTVGRFCVIGPVVTIGPDCLLADFVSLGSNVHMEEKVKIAEGAKLNANVSVVEGVEIGSWCEVPLRKVVEGDVLDRSQ